MPAYSLVDQKRIQDLMNNREIFPALIDSERSKVLEHLLQISGRILSLHTFSQDWLFLELPSKALRGLLPKTFKGSVKNALLKKYVNTENSYIIQTSAAGYRMAAGTLKAASYLSYVQLWLCATRLFVSPLKDSHTTETIHTFSSIRVTREIIFSFFGREPIYDQILELPESPEHEGHSSGSPGVPFERSILPGQPSVLSSYIESTVPSGMNKLTVPQASGFEDFSGDPNTRLDIAANRSAAEILNMWYASQDVGLIVFYMFSTRQFYKFWNDDFALRSTICSLSKDHFFMHYVGKKGQSLPDERILAVAKEESLLFVGLKTAPGISITASASVDDIEKYVSMHDTKTGKRKVGRLTRSRQEEEEDQDDAKRTREVHEIDEEL
ncbi:hypothetical protein ACJ73_01578 [Blastomyces percursus]|uniref:Uncharacterized protein n=1 Tax=Blastomyces percursus TaxID=1658174 RepID=A0A1J9QEU6_9EURO|nr:hypothetical protein ACJ73_01578 [Blastomyces percursus]